MTSSPAVPLKDVPSAPLKGAQMADSAFHTGMISRSCEEGKASSNDEDITDFHQHCKNSLCNSVKPKKRRKVVKSCTFCRKRKLKCDRKRPMCTGCKERGLTECIYTDGYNFDISHDEIYSSTPNLKLLQEIDKLKEQLQEKSEQEAKQYLGKQVNEDSTEPRSINYLTRYKFVLRKKERVMRYGCTSLRTLIGLVDPRLSKYFKDIGLAHKENRKRPNSWVIGTSSMYELQRVERPWSLDLLIADLPKYSELCSSILKAFRYKGYQVLRIFSEEKIMQYLTECFKVKDDVITGVVPYGKLNYFPVAIVLHLHITYMNAAPPSFTSFFVMLLGQTTAKVCYVERVQFLMLTFMWKAARGQHGGDNSHLSPLVELMASAALEVGLNDCDDHLQQERNVLKSLWNWILYFDVMVAIDIGRPHVISSQIFDSELLLKDDFSYPDEPADEFGLAYMKLMRKFTYHARNFNDALHWKDRVPDLDKSLTAFESLLEEVWPERYEFFMGDKTTVRPLSYKIITICAPTLSLICIIKNLKKLCFNDNSVYSQNSLANYSFMLIDLIMGALVQSYTWDRQTFGDQMTATHTLTSNVRFTLGMLSTHWCRNLSDVYMQLFSQAINKSSFTDMAPFEVSETVSCTRQISFESLFKGYQRYYHQLNCTHWKEVYEYLSLWGPFAIMFIYESAGDAVMKQLIQSLSINTGSAELHGALLNGESSAAVEGMDLPPTISSIPQFNEVDIETICNDFWKDSGMLFEEMFDSTIVNSLERSNL